MDSMSGNRLPHPVLKRLASLSSLTDQLLTAGIDRVTSGDLERLTGSPAHTIRKDLSPVGALGGRKGYPVVELRTRLRSFLGLDREKKVCVVGLGNLGASFLSYEGFREGYRIVAGFESSLNRRELIDTVIPLYSSFEIESMVRLKGIELGIITVPAAAAQQVFDRLLAGGIRGVVNFSPTLLETSDSSVFIRNVYVMNELNILSALINQSEMKS